MLIIKREFPQAVLIFCATVAVMLAAILDLSLGITNISMLDFFQDSNAVQREVLQQIFLEVRLPRVVLVICVGFCLGMSGAVLQGLLQNPLAGPGLLGISNAAALGAVIVLFYGFAALHPLLVPLGGLFGAAVAVGLILYLAGNHASSLNLILAGVAVGAVMSSLIALALNFSSNPYAMSEIVFWLLGSLDNRSMQDVYLITPFVATGCVMMYLSRYYLDALSLGYDTAQTMGFDNLYYRRWIVISVALAVGAAVSVSGSIGFVGLVVPHLVRPFVAHKPSRLLLPSGLIGALLLLLADSLAQYFAAQGGAQQNLKLGVITALLGGPFFLYLLIRWRYEIH